MTINPNWGFPPKNLANCIGVICNGEMEITPQLRDKICKCHAVIGVDGGLAFCKQMNLSPQWIVGDFDSVEPSILEEMQKSAKVVTLPRAKDSTDLEVAIEKAKTISKHAQIVIWGGLGKRIDHTLGNLFPLLRNPGQIFLESEQQVVFAVSESVGEIEITNAAYKTLAIFPLTGAAKEVSIKTGKEATVCSIVEKNSPVIFPFQNQCLLKIGYGELLVILDKREIAPLSELPIGDMTLSFSLSFPLIQILAYLAHQSKHSVKLSSPTETVLNIKKASGKVTVQSKKGQVISLIPFYGSASGIRTEGLKWELGENATDKLDKEFIGICNVSMGDVFSISVDQGELLCIVNEIIDEELVEAKVEHLY